MTWEITEDFSETAPAVTRLGITPPVSMPLQVKVDESEMRETRAGNNRVVLYLATEGPKGAEGFEFSDGLNVPEGTHAALQRRFWMTTLISLGHAEAKLKKKLKLSPKTTDGRTGYVYFTTKEDAGGEYYDVKWLTKNQYTKMVAKLKDSGELDELIARCNKAATAQKEEGAAEVVLPDDEPEVEDGDDSDDDDDLDILDI